MSDRRQINAGSVMVELLRSFPELLRTKRVDPGAVYFREAEGCLMDFAYPGQIVATASPFLRDRPVNLWPQVSLNLTPTNELRTRAREILNFLQSSAPTDRDPN